MTKPLITADAPIAEKPTVQVPTEGGSYTVNADGSLKQVQATQQLPPVPEPPKTEEN